MKVYALVLSLVALSSTPAWAEMSAEPPPAGAMMFRAPLPQPPTDNPHAPQSAEDRKRVDFAVQEIRSYYGPKVEIRHAHIIPWSFENFQKNRTTSPKPPLTPDHSNPNVIIEAQPSLSGQAPPSQNKMAEGSMAPMRPMPAPNLKPDEYMVHAYVLFPQDPRWYHVDVILSEDSTGNLVRRNFFVIPMPPVGGSLPPGVVC